MSVQAPEKPPRPSSAALSVESPDRHDVPDVPLLRLGVRPQKRGSRIDATAPASPSSQSLASPLASPSSQSPLASPSSQSFASPLASPSSQPLTSPSSPPRLSPPLSPTMSTSHSTPGALNSPGESVALSLQASRSTPGNLSSAPAEPPGRGEPLLLSKKAFSFRTRLRLRSLTRDKKDDEPVTHSPNPLHRTAAQSTSPRACAPSAPLPKGMPAVEQSPSPPLSGDEYPDDEYVYDYDVEGGATAADYYSAGFELSDQDWQSTSQSLSEEQKSEPRTRLFFELLETERNYVRQLHWLVEGYLVPLGTRLQGTDKERFVEQISYDILEVIPIHETLLHEMERLREGWDAATSRLSGVFAEALPRFVDYSNFFAHYDSAVDSFWQLVESDELIRELLDACDAVAKSSGVPSSVLNYLILPIQRLPRYALLLRNLLDKTPADHPDHAALTATLAELETINAAIDETVDHARRQRRSLSIGNRLAACHGVELQSKVKELVWDAKATLTAFHPTPVVPTLAGDAQRRDGSAGREVLVLLASDALLLVSDAVAAGGKKKERRRHLLTGMGSSAAGKSHHHHQQQQQQQAAEPLCIPLSVIWVGESGHQKSTTVKLVTPQNTYQLEFASKTDKQTFVGHLIEQTNSDYRANTPAEQQAQTSPDMLTRYAVLQTSGWSYEGWWLLGVRHGVGKMTSADCTTYTGSFSDNQRHGRGQLTYCNGAVYTGDFFEDELHGDGRLVFPDGSVYAGGFVRGNKEGRGVYTSPTLSYAGDWEKNAPHGTGKLVVKPPSSDSGGGVQQQQVEGGAQQLSDDEFLVSYEGSWKNGLPSGTGLMAFRNASNFYTGQFKRGQYHGQGFVNTPLMRFEGEFRRGLKHGFGKQEIFFKEQNFGQGIGGSTVYRGEFARDKRHGKGKLLCYDGSTYEGDWQDDLFHGNGTLIDGDSKYVGAFVRGEKHGPGQLTVTTAQGVVAYTGSFFRGQITGNGTWTNASGASIEGHWESGSLLPKPLPSVALPPAMHSELLSESRQQLAGSASKTGVVYAGPMIFDVPPSHPRETLSGFIHALAWLQ